MNAEIECADVDSTEVCGAISRYASFLLKGIPMTSGASDGGTAGTSDRWRVPWRCCQFDHGRVGANSAGHVVAICQEH